MIATLTRARWHELIFRDYEGQIVNSGTILRATGCRLGVYRGRGPNVYAVGGELTTAWEQAHPERHEALIEALRRTAAMPQASLGVGDSGFAIEAPRFVGFRLGRFYRFADLVAQAFCIGIDMYPDAVAPWGSITYRRPTRQIILSVPPVPEENISLFDMLTDLFRRLSGVRVTSSLDGEVTIILPRTWRRERTSVTGFALAMVAAYRAGAGLS